MSRRLPSTPPTLPGFTFVRVLGSGGFADVYLFEQQLPRRLVAVKVMLSDVVNDELRQLFQAEANLMARLSAHPAILTVHQAGVAADGRPYLVMEYCVATIGQRYRIDPLSVPEALSTMIRIAGAVETAHRDGVLHRDIKPSNILTTSYGHPVLSDFGIASTVGGVAATEAIGLSIPWSAPELLRDELPGDVASEVWSLGATLFSLVAGRSPFEVVGGDNSGPALMARIVRGGPKPLGRPEAPASLEAVIRRSLSRRPDERQSSALAFLRDLQAIETELGLEQTPVDLQADAWASEPGVDLDDPTALERPEPAPRPAARRRRPRPATSPVDTARRPIGATARRGPLASGWWIAGIIGALVVGIALGAIGAVLAGDAALGSSGPASAAGWNGG